MLYGGMIPEPERNPKCYHWITDIRGYRVWVDNNKRVMFIFDLTIQNPDQEYGSLGKYLHLDVRKWLSIRYGL